MQWIKASERLPEEKKAVFIKNGDKRMSAFHFNYGWCDLDSEWMYMTDTDDDNDIFWLDESETPSSQSVTGWVSVEERLPEYTQDIAGNKATGNVLVLIGGDVHSAFLESVRPAFIVKIWSPSIGGDTTDIEKYYGEKVTHWQPLPALPTS